MSIGVVVTTWNTLNFLKPMVDSIKCKYNHSIIIVDNNSRDGIDEWIKPKVESEPDKWFFIKQKEFFSMGHNRNTGMRLAYDLGCSHIVLSQEDVLLHKDCVNNLVDEKELRPEFMFVSAWGIQPYDLPEYYELTTSPLKRVLPEERIKSAPFYHEIKKEEGDTILSCSSEMVAEMNKITPKRIYGPSFIDLTCFKREFIDKVGYYDEGFTSAEHQNLDLIYRCYTTTGVPVGYWTCQLSLFIHWGGGSLLNNGLDWQTYKPIIMSHNEERYKKKWGGPMLGEKWVSPVPQPSLWEAGLTYYNLTRKNIDFTEFKEKAWGMSDEEFYAAYDAAFKKIGFFDYTLTNLEYFESWIRGDLLEVGCSSGLLLKTIRGRCKRCVGIDISSYALEEAKKMLPPDVELYRGDAEKSLPFPSRCFDTVICGHTLEHLRQPLNAVKEMKRVCRNRIIILIPLQGKGQMWKKTNMHLQFWPTVEDFEEFFGEKAAESIVAREGTLAIMRFEGGVYACP